LRTIVVSVISENRFPISPGDVGSVRMVTVDGTSLYEEFQRHHVVPPLVMDAIALGRRFGFTYSVHPATGRLLAALAAGVANGVIGETGTGTGAGVAWMLSAASPATRVVSVELDVDRAAAAAALFASDDRVTILQGDANALASHGPFDLLVLDAPSTPGPLEWASLEPTVHLRPNGLLVKDDLWPMTSWPPTTFDGAVDVQRQRWFEHPHLFTTEVTVAERYAVLIARRRP
jgi:predicted O-methyltransferase YrrM